MDLCIRRLPPIAGGSDAEPVETAGAGEEHVPAGETAHPEPGAIVAPEKAAEPAKVESFINPADLPEELKPHWSRMHRAYTKAREEINASKADLDFLTQYRSNPDVARQVLQQEAARLGLTLTTGSQPAPQPNGTAAPATSASAEGVPSQLVKAIEANLAPELKWMAPSMGPAVWEAIRLAVGPLVAKDEAKEQAGRVAEYERLAADLAGTAPGWEEHEKTMNELLAFLRSPNLTHPTFGSKLAILHGHVTNGARARVAAAQSMAEAARNRTTTGGSARSVTTNVADRVRGAGSLDEAMRIAAEAAVEELKRSGQPVPA